MAASNGKKSKLPAKTNQRRNTKAGREQMSPGQFALPDQKKYRIDDPAHARDALARVAQNGTPQEQAKVKRAVRAKYPSIDVTGATKTGSSKSSARKPAAKRKTGGK